LIDKIPNVHSSIEAENEDVFPEFQEGFPESAFQRADSIPDQKNNQ
jgi:hypothetical protein